MRLPGTLPSPVLFQPDEVLAGVRVTGFRYELLDNDEQLIGELQSVTGGSAEWTAATAVKGGGSLEVTDIGAAETDWLNVRIRPVVLVSATGTAVAEYPVGVFIPAAPVEDWSETGRSWKIELMDKLSILDQDIPTNSNGDPVTYVLPAGTNVISAVVNLITAAGETANAIEPDTKTLPAAVTWELGTSVLKIINDLLTASGYASLWSDGTGQFRTTPYVPPSQRSPVYSALSPFVKGENSLMAPSWRRDRDIYSIPNRYVAISSGSGAAEALVAVVTNEDPASPFSYPARGRWITHVETGVEATSQADLESRARMGLSAATSITSGISVQHVFLPELLINSVVQFRDDDAGVDLLCYVTRTTVQFETTELCQSELREAVV